MAAGELLASCGSVLGQAEGRGRTRVSLMGYLPTASSALQLYPLLSLLCSGPCLLEAQYLAAARGEGRKEETRDSFQAEKGYGARLQSSI